MKFIICTLLIISSITADCFDLIKADTMDVNKLIKKHYNFTNLFPKDEGQEDVLQYLRDEISNCLKDLKNFEHRCSFHILAYFTGDTSLAIYDIEELKIIKEKYKTITNTIILGRMKESVCGYKSYFTTYDHFQKLINDYSVPEITAEEFIKHIKREKRSENVDLYISYYRNTYYPNKSKDYPKFLAKINEDPFLKLVAHYLRKNPTSPFEDLSNDSLLNLINNLLKMDDKYMVIIMKGKHVFKTLKNVKYSIFKRWKEIDHIKEAGIDSTNIELYNENIKFLKAPEINEMLNIIGKSLSSEEKKRTIYPDVVNFVDSLQAVGNKK